MSKDDKYKKLQQIVLDELGDATEEIDIPDTLEGALSPEVRSRKGAEKLLDMVEDMPDVPSNDDGGRMLRRADIMEMAESDPGVNKVVKTRYSGKKPAPNRLPVEPPSITDEMRVKAEMADAKRAYKEMLPLDADDLDDVEIDVDKLNKYKRADGAIRSPRAEVLKKIQRGFGRAAKPIGKTLGAVSKAATAASLPLSLLSMDEANAGSDEMDEQMLQETENSPEMGEARQEAYNMDAEREDRLQRIKKLLGK